MLEIVVIAVFALSVNVKTHIEMIPITTAAIFEAVDILNTVEVLNSSWKGTLSRLRNLTSDICDCFLVRLRPWICGAALKGRLVMASTVQPVRATHERLHAAAAQPFGLQGMIVQ